jgi:DNA-binding beta-propeller fold protein YncE/mono/diheme cytochrome c family protein
MRFFGFLLTVIWIASLSPSTAEAQSDYTLFESGPVRPIAMSPDGSRLFVVNTPDGYLEIFDVSSGSALKEASVPVGLEPVSVAARNNDEVWVVNHLSDSISIVDVASAPPRVVRTLLVGDEPRGIVFAGPGGDRAFIATAHRGQNTPWPDGDYDVPGIGRADVWVFDANNLGTSLTGDPLTVIQLFGDRPRALTASPDGSTVYAAVFRSGNRTVPISEGLVCDGSGPCNVQGTSYPAGRPFPETNFQGITSRETGIIVGFNDLSGNWEDEMGNDWSPAVRFSLPDLDVFEIDANASTPVETDAFSGVGTVLFNMIVNPANGKLYVTNTEANNRVRFEGFGDYTSSIGSKPSGDPASVRGNLHQARITVIEPTGNVLPRHLNKHIPYGVSPVPAGVKEKSVATPLQMAVSSDGTTLYVAGFGSNAIATYDTTQLENDTFVPDASSLIPIDRPSGLVLDEARGLLWVISRGTSTLYTIDLNTKVVTYAAGLHNPEQFALKRGRKLLYDTQLTSSNGEASCSSCHVFGDMDDLSWDLGDPDAVPFANPNPTPPTDEFPLIQFLPPLQPFDSLKGPMTTQSLRGMKNSGPMHWRGDRTGGATGGDPLDSNAAFLTFNVAFPGLIGRDEGELDPSDMQAFADFALALTYPPNPIRPLDNSLSSPAPPEPSAAAGEALYNGQITDTVANCNGCHALDRAQGFFGTSGASTFENEAMEFKVPHLRNAYQKVGMFGERPTNFFPDADGSFMGDQVRGTGFLHDGSVSTVFNFVGAGVFSIDDNQQRDLEAFMMEFDSDLAPIVGQQATLTSNSGSDTLDRIVLLLMDRAETTYYTSPELGAVKECDLIVKGVLNGEYRGWLYEGNDTFTSDDSGDPPWSTSALLAVADQPGQELTFTCVPPGSGTRMGINRDRDAFLDANDTVPDRLPPSSCSAGRLGRASHEGNLFALILAILGLAVVRRRRPA